MVATKFICYRESFLGLPNIMEISFETPIYQAAEQLKQLLHSLDPQFDTTGFSDQEIRDYCNLYN